MAFVFIAICVFVIMMITQVAVSTLLVPQAMATRQSLPTVIYVQINFAPDLPSTSARNSVRSIMIGAKTGLTCVLLHTVVTIAVLD